MLENAVESRDDKISKLEKEVKRLEYEVSVTSMHTCEKCDCEKHSSEDIQNHTVHKHTDSDIPSTSTCGKCDYKSDDEDNMEMHMNSDHGEKCESFTCEKCNHTSKDEWKHITHICKVHINNPTFRDLYTKEWLDQNGCNAIYSADLQEDILWLHSDNCWKNEHPCSWIPFNLQGKPTKPGEVRHFKFTQIVKNGSICWSSLSE